VKYVQEGGNNSKYFILITNGKHREKIFQLEHDEGTIVGDENLKVFSNEYYKKLFGAPDKNNFSMMEDPSVVHSGKWPLDC
jgi:hypothetical protein